MKILIPNDSDFSVICKFQKKLENSQKKCALSVRLPIFIKIPKDFCGINILRVELSDLHFDFCSKKCENQNFLGDFSLCAKFFGENSLSQKNKIRFSLLRILSGMPAPFCEDFFLSLKIFKVATAEFENPFIWKIFDAKWKKNLSSSTKENS